MKPIFIVLLLFSFAGVAQVLDPARLQQHCQKPLVDEPIIYQEDYSFSDNLDVAKMTAKFDRFYQGPQRLKGRLFYDSKAKKIYTSGDLNSEISPLLIESISAHISLALKRNYAQFAFFPDMGHSHFYIPKDVWNKKYKDLAPATGLYAALSNERQLKMLYHTAEQLVIRDSNKVMPLDPWLQWRYYSRNIMGQNRGASSSLEVLLQPDLQAYNTVKEYDDYASYSAGFYLQAHQNGCFSFQAADGKTLYFDVSFDEFPVRNHEPDPN